MVIKKQHKNIEHNDYRRSICKKSAEKAIKKLLKSNSKVNFSSVSKLSGVSRAYLYNNKELRSKIESYREIQYAGGQVKAGVSQKSKDIIINELYKKIDSLEKKLNKKDEKIKKLEKKLNYYNFELFEY